MSGFLLTVFSRKFFTHVPKVQIYSFKFKEYPDCGMNYLSNYADSSYIYPKYDSRAAFFSWKLL